MAVPLFIYFGALNGLQGAFWECLFLYLLVLNQRLEVKEDQTEIFYSTGNCLFVLRLESEPRFSGILLVCVWGESLDFFLLHSGNLLPGVLHFLGTEEVLRILSWDS